MPRSPAKPCTTPGCPILGRCPTHTRDPRPSAARRGYDARWQAFRRAYMAHHPTCEWPDCNQPSTDLDHIDGQGPKGPRGYDPANVQALCKPHHSKKTATQNHGFGR